MKRQLDMAEVVRFAQHASQSQFSVYIKELALGLKTYTLAAKDLKAPIPPKKRGRKRKRVLPKPGQGKRPKRKKRRVKK